LFKLFIPFVISAEQSDVNGKLDVPDIFPQPPRNLKRVILPLTMEERERGKREETWPMVNNVTLAHGNTRARTPKAISALLGSKNVQ
jgi:hypothetical protein